MSLQQTVTTKVKHRNSQNYRHKKCSWSSLSLHRVLFQGVWKVHWVWVFQKFGGLLSVHAICMLPGLLVKPIQEAPFSNGLIRNSLYAVLAITAVQISTDKNVSSTSEEGLPAPWRAKWLKPRFQDWGQGWRMMQKNEAWWASTMASLQNNNSNCKPTGPPQTSSSGLNDSRLSTTPVKKDGLTRKEKRIEWATGPWAKSHMAALFSTSFYFPTFWLLPF